MVLFLLPLIGLTTPDSITADQQKCRKVPDNSLVWFGLVWFGVVWFGLVWFGFFGCDFCQLNANLDKPREN